MLYLLIAVFTSAMIPIVFKYANDKNVSPSLILTVNYMVAVIMSVIIFMFHIDEYQGFWSISNLLPTIINGILQGAFFYGAFYYYQRSVQENGVAVSISVGKMGLLIPMLLSLLFWKEFPTSFQWIAVVLSLIAIYLICVNPNALKKAHFNPSLLYFLIISGLGDFSNKYFETTIGSAYADFFLIIVFASALIISLPPTLRVQKQHKLESLGIFFGIMTGLPNMLTSLFFIMTLGILNALVAFPAYNGGAVMLSTLYGVLVFKESMNKKKAFGILLIVISLFLINQ